MRVLLAAWGSRGDIEPLAGLALALRQLGAEVRACAPPDEEFVALFGRAGVQVIPLGRSVRAVVTGVTPPPGGAFRLAAELVAARFDVLGAAAEGCDALETRARARAVAGMIRTDGAKVAAQRLLDASTRGHVT